MADKDNRQSDFDRTVYPTNIDEDVPISYDYTETQEVIYFRFYNKDFDYDKAALLLEYVGLETFTSRPYLKDIVRSDTFAYKNIIENGDFTTDISFTGQGKTVDMDKALR